MSMNEPRQHVDLRIRRTEYFLREALLALLAERDYASISVADLCRRAMVHRSTFYAHYADKDELLTQSVHQRLELLFDALRLRVGEIADLRRRDDVLDMLTAGFEHVAANRRFYRLMVAGSMAGFSEQFGRALVAHLLDRSEARIDGTDPGVRRRHELRAEAHAGVLVATIRWWLRDVRPFPPDMMARYLWEDIFSAGQLADQVAAGRTTPAAATRANSF